MRRHDQDGGAVAACGNAAGMDLPTSVAPFILRGVSLLGINSVTLPRALREEAWARLVRDLDREKLKAMTTTIGFDDIRATAEKIVGARCAAGWWSRSPESRRSRLPAKRITMAGWKARVERRLSAIMAADVVGYSRLIEVDETATIAAVRALRVEVDRAADRRRITAASSS